MRHRPYSSLSTWGCAFSGGLPRSGFILGGRCCLFKKLTKNQLLDGRLRIYHTQSPLDCKEIQAVHPKGNQS